MFILRSSLFLPFITVLFLAESACADDWYADGVDRVVAIADVHGAYDSMVETLENVGIIDANLAWVGGESHLVIVGDLLDRGPRSRDALDLLIRLESEAAAAGGKVQVLIGNHEMMNMVGDMRYVSKAEYEAFAADETTAQRNRWYQAWLRRTGITSGKKQKFDSTFPRGYFALRSAFLPSGQYGKWLLEKNVIAVVNRTAFVHGGLPPAIAELGLEGVNQGLKQDLVDYVNAVAVLLEAEVLLPTDAYYDYAGIANDYMPPLNATADVIAAVETVKRLDDAAVLHSDGPLWYRGNVACNEIIEEHRLRASLDAIGADRVVVGHTPTPSRKVEQRFDGRVIEVDTGMLNFYYKGSGNALVLEGGELRVFNQSGSEAYAPLSQQRMVGSRSMGLTVEKLRTLLETGEISRKGRADKSGRTMVEVSDDTHTVSAVFSKKRGKGFYPNVAAYRLDRMLGLDMVPVTARRTYEGNDGSLQFLPERFSDEKKRSSSGRGGSASCGLAQQWGAMYVFDVLIYNEGRNLERMLYDTARWNLMLVAHERAFKNAKGRPPHLESAPVHVSQGWREALTGLTDEMLVEYLADVLDKRRLKALGNRRDQLLAE